MNKLIKGKHTKRNILIITSIMVVLGASGTILLSTSQPTSIIEEECPDEIKNSSLYIPDTLSVFGENVPLNYSDVYESLDKELLINAYWQSQTIIFLKKADKYLPMIDSILKANNIPSDFRYLPIIESGLTFATSPAGAKGFWQFMENTAKEYGLTVNDEIDERLNIEKSTVAACKYLRRGYDKFNNWTIVAASYNMGMNGISQRLDVQKVDSYYDLNLNAETSRYVFRLLAIKLIFENPEKYGFYINKKDCYPAIKYNVVSVDSTITNIPLFAKNMGTNYKIFMTLNPWMQSKKLTNANKKVYYFKIPTENSRNRNSE